MRRIHRHWRQQRIQFLFAVFFDEAQRSGSNSCSPRTRIPFSAERRTQPRIPAVVLIVDKFVGQLVQQIPFFGKGQAVRAGLVVAVFNLLHHGGDAHFEELVEIAGGDGEKLQPLEQRIAFVLGLFEHTPIEREP